MRIRELERRPTGSNERVKETVKEVFRDNGDGDKWKQKYEHLRNTMDQTAEDYKRQIAVFQERLLSYEMQLRERQDVRHDVAEEVEVIHHRREKKHKEKKVKVKKSKSKKRSTSSSSSSSVGNKIIIKETVTGIDILVQEERDKRRRAKEQYEERILKLELHIEELFSELEKTRSSDGGDKFKQIIEHVQERRRNEEFRIESTR
jgi:hypothetical protein